MNRPDNVDVGFDAGLVGSISKQLFSEALADVQRAQREEEEAHAEEILKEAAPPKANEKEGEDLDAIFPTEDDGEEKKVKAKSDQKLEAILKEREQRRKLEKMVTLEDTADIDQLRNDRRKLSERLEKDPEFRKRYIAAEAKKAEEKRKAEVEGLIGKINSFKPDESNDKGNGEDEEEEEESSVPITNLYIANAQVINIYFNDRRSAPTHHNCEN